MPKHPLILSDKELLVIQLMINSSPPIYGLDLVKKSDGKLKEGTVYVTLGRMEDKGYISSTKEAARPGYRGLPRRLYKLEAKGRHAHSVSSSLLLGGAGYATA